jgi:CheY-like chemotaxis protein
MIGGNRHARADRSGLAIGLLALTLCASSRAEDSAADVAAARTFGGDGVTLADAGKCAEAIEKLERAEKLHHAATTAARLGECDIDVGKVVLGTEILQRLLRETLAPNAPPAFVTAHARAQRVLQAALPKIGNLRIAVRVAAGTKVVLSIDGEPVSDVFIDNDRPTDPGAHTVMAKAQGFLPTSSKINLKDGETTTVTLTLEPDPNATVVSAVEPALVASGLSPRRPADAPEPAPRSSNTLAYAALGVGAVGILTGAITGGLAVSKASKLSDKCPGKVCQPSAESDLSSAKTLATVSTVGFVVGGVGAAAGLVLLFSSSPNAASPAASTARAHVRPLLGAGYLGFDGTF